MIVTLNTMIDHDVATGKPHSIHFKKARFGASHKQKLQPRNSDQANLTSLALDFTTVHHFPPPSTSHQNHCTRPACFLNRRPQRPHRISHFSRILPLNTSATQLELDECTAQLELPTERVTFFRSRTNQPKDRNSSLLPSGECLILRPNSGYCVTAITFTLASSAHFPLKQTTNINKLYILRTDAEAEERAMAADTRNKWGKQRLEQLSSFEAEEDCDHLQRRQQHRRCDRSVSCWRESKCDQQKWNVHTSYRRNKFWIT